MTMKRWPNRVYGIGTEPDPRFTLANERTFLAWVRTSMALIAAGVAVHELADGLVPWARVAIATALLVAGLWCAIAAWFRWAHTEGRMRRQLPLSGAATMFALVLFVMVIAAVLLIVIFV